MTLKKKEGPEKEKRKAVRHSNKSNYNPQEHSEGMVASKD